MKKLSLILFLSFILLTMLSMIGFAVEYQQAPMLDKKVESGELPPLEERLPDNPLVIGPGMLISEEDLDWQPGQYGGTLETVHSNPNWNPDLFVMVHESLLNAPGIGVQNIFGTILEDFEVSNNNQVFTFKIREGLKWSDGVPVTTEDVRFTYEDVLLNEKLTPLMPAKFKTGGTPQGEDMDLEIIDKYTFQIKFPEPYGGFLRQLAIQGWTGYTDLLKPKHALTKYHIKYTDLDDMEEALKEEQLEDEWWDLFSAKDILTWDILQEDAVGFPTLNPWIRVEGPSQMIVLERNPYYFAVDTEGKQLPYIDNLRSMEVSNTEIATMRVITGEADYLREDTSLVKMPLYKENAEKGGYRVQLLDMHVDSTIIKFNMTYEDKVWREVSRDKRFRKAISLGVDREEIIETVYFGFAEMPEHTPHQFDPEAANRLLDEMGMNERDKEGFRLGPDGESFEMHFPVQDAAPDLIPVAELITQQLRENLDLKTSMKQISNELFAQRNTANEIKCQLGWGHDQGWDNSRSLTSQTLGPSILWDTWNSTQGKEGEKPPAWAKKAYEIDEKRWKTVPGSEEYNRLRQEGFAWYEEHITDVTLVQNVPYPVIVNKDLGNVPTSGFGIASDFSGEQFFFKK